MAPRVTSEITKLCAEFLGTFFLVFTVGLTQTVGKNTGDDPAKLNPTQIFGVTSIAMVLVVMVYALGPVSGGHFNPAVTFAAMLQHKVEKKEALMYMISQLLAGFSAAMATGFMYGFNDTASMKPNEDMGKGVWIGAPLIEFLYTCMLCFVVLNCCMSNRPAKQGNQYFGVAIGFVIIAGGYGGGQVSGGAFNPAVALGVNFLNLDWQAMYCPIYMACEMAGAFVAVELFHLISPSDKVEAFVESNKLAMVIHKIESLFDPDDTSEMLGTFFLALTWALNGVVKVQNADKGGNPAGVWSIAASLMCMIWAVGDISGGLFNPALTFAVLGRYMGTGQGIGEKNEKGEYDRLCDPAMSKKEGPKYLIAQSIGGAAGAAVCFFVVWSWPPGAPIAVGEGYTYAQAFFAEFFGTFLLAYVVLCVALVRNPLKEYTAFAIGGCIIAGGYGFAPLSGGVLNPAIAIANGLLSLALFTTATPILYVIAEVLGGCAAVVVFKFLTHTHEYGAAHLQEPLEAGYLQVDNTREAPRG
jgi:aquaporin Z